MKRHIVWSIATIVFLMFTSSAYAERWCCMVEGKVQAWNEKKMCVKSKKAPSEKSKPESKKAKYFAPCKEAGGEWAIKGKKKLKKN